MASKSFRARSCLFCHEETSSLPSEIEIKEEEEAGVDNFVLNIQSWKVPLIVKENLKSVFIVRKLLDMPAEKCAEYLQHNDDENGSEHHSSWFAVCKTCNSTVEESYKIYRKIKRLECNLETLKVKLKHSILDVKINEDSCGPRRTRGSIGLGKAKDFIHVDIRKFVTEENVHILLDQGIPVATQQTVKRVKRRNLKKVTEITPVCDFPDSDWHVDSPIADYDDAPDFDTEWQPPVSNQESESDHRSSNVKDEKVDAEYDSDYIPSLKIRKRKSRCKTGTKSCRKRKKKSDNEFVGDTEQVSEKKGRNAGKPLRSVYVHKCNLCGLVFKTIKFFQQHEKLHANNEGFPCTHCGWLYRSKRALHMHMFEKHNKPKAMEKPRKNKYNCEFMEAIPYYCDHCHMIYKSKVLILRHIQNYHDNIAYLPCNFCDSQFPTKQLLELHLKGLHPSFSETGNDDVPAQESKEERQMCEHCSQSFPSKLKLDFHIATYHQDVLLTCKICGHKSEKFYMFLQHKRSKHYDQDKRDQQYMCENCPKKFSSSYYLTCHMKAIHFDLLGINPLICEKCNVTFPTPAALVEHENHVHMKIKGRCCEYCGKAFSRGCDLKRHILLHTATREEQYKKGPFFCQFCQAKFNVRQALYYHLKKHHTDKFAHKCDYCGTGYVTQNTLLQHLRKCKAKKQTPTPSTQNLPSSAATIDVSVQQEANNA